MAAARDEVEEEHQQALKRAKQRRAGAHAEKRAWRERCVRPSGALSRVPSDPAPHAPRSARAPLTLRPTQASALLQPGRAGCRRGRGARWARRGRHVLHGIGSVASVGPKGRQVASAGRLCRRRRCAEPADRPVLARAGSFAGAGSCRHRRPRGRRHLPRRHQLSALLVARAVDRCAHLHPSLPCPPARGVAPLPYLPPSLDALCPP